MAADFRFQDHGSVALLERVTEAGWRWINENILTEADGNEQQWFGRSLVIEHRYVGPVLVGLVRAGLRCSRALP